MLQEAYRSSESRMSQELLRRHVLKVLRVWRGWYIFGDDFLNGLQASWLDDGLGLLCGALLPLVGRVLVNLSSVLQRVQSRGCSLIIRASLWRCMPGAHAAGIAVLPSAGPRVFL